MAKVHVIGKDGRAMRDVDLPDTVFAAPLKGSLIHAAVLAFRAAARAGTHATKNRSDVRGGGKKPWKQKKTGRSRHGSIRSPIWRGGGTVFGPQPRDYTWGFPRRMRHGALRSALSMKLRNGKLVIVPVLELETPKTKALRAMVSGLGIAGSALLVDEPVNRNLELAARNLQGVTTTRSTAINIVDLLKHETIVLTEAAAGRVAEVLAP